MDLPAFRLTRSAPQHVGDTRREIGLSRRSDMAEHRQRLGDLPQAALRAGLWVLPRKTARVCHHRI